MILGISPARAVGGFALLAGVGVAVVVGGWGTPPNYPPDLAYPPRTDWLVELPPTQQPAGPEPAGQLDQTIARMNDLGGKVHNPARLSAAHRGQLEAALAEVFGTPAAPTVAGDGEVGELADRLHLTPERLGEGSRVFRRNCLQCHGLTGDGRGPTGPWVQPHPRDFRRGVFKYVSTEGSGPRKPCRDDLLRTVRTGVEGASMPAFGLLADGDLEGVVSYVVHLSLRGEVEYQVMLTLLRDGDDGLETGDVAAECRSWLKALLQQWVLAEETPVTPGPEPDGDRMESVRRGHRLFTDRSALGCVTCHEDFGRQATYRYDVWGTVVRPGELTEATYRGGKRPVDLFWRIRGGIGPSGMPAAASLDDGQVWDLVHFVQALPYPKMLPPDVREKVFPPR
jgi:mono/diheme cytochrome c family protein